MFVHRRGKPHDGVAGHQAVCIQDKHAFIAGTKPLDPILDIAGFARGVFRTVTVENSRRWPSFVPESKKTLFFGDPDGGIGRVAQNKPVELGGASGFLDRFIDRTQPGQDAIGVLVVGGQQHRGPAFDRR